MRRLDVLVLTSLVLLVACSSAETGGTGGSSGTQGVGGAASSGAQASSGSSSTGLSVGSGGCASTGGECGGVGGSGGACIEPTYEESRETCRDYVDQARDRAEALGCDVASTIEYDENFCESDNIGDPCTTVVRQEYQCRIDALDDEDCDCSPGEGGGPGKLVCPAMQDCYAASDADLCCPLLGGEGGGSP